MLMNIVLSLDSSYEYTFIVAYTSHDTWVQSTSVCVIWSILLFQKMKTDRADMFCRHIVSPVESSRDAKGKLYLQECLMWNDESIKRLMKELHPELYLRTLLWRAKHLVIIIHCWLPLTNIIYIYILLCGPILLTNQIKSRIVFSNWNLPMWLDMLVNLVF